MERDRVRESKCLDGRYEKLAKENRSGTENKNTTLGGVVVVLRDHNYYETLT